MKAYHLLLNQKFSFPALTGLKPLHRAADVFNLSGAEELMANLDLNRKIEFVLNEPYEQVIEDIFTQGIEVLEGGDTSLASEKFFKVIDVNPNHIDALYHIAFIEYEKGNYHDARVYTSAAITVGFNLLGNEFCWNRAELRWAYLRNRPFLRAYHMLGLVEQNTGNIQLAADIYERLLMVNPNDNQGIRMIIPECWHELGLHEKVYRLWNDNYSNDYSSELPFSVVLSLFALNRKKEAAELLAEVNRNSPLFIREMLKKNHPKPKDASIWGVATGSHDEAFKYWQRNGNNWSNTAGALEFLSEFSLNNPIINKALQRNKECKRLGKYT